MLGIIRAIRSGDKSAIVWEYAGKTVWLADVQAVGSKAAMYAFHRREVVGCSHRDAMARLDRAERAAATMTQVVLKARADLTVAGA